jgi:flagellar biogenesis protein FliO
VIARRITPIAALFFLGQYAASGQTPSPAPFPDPISAHNSGGMVQIAIYFVLITALLLAGLYFTRTGFNGLLRKGKGEKKLIISEARTLGNRQFLIVAEYENRKMLLGVCPGRIDYLSTLSTGHDDTFSTELPDKPE